MISVRSVGLVASAVLCVAAGGFPQQPSLIYPVDVIVDDGGLIVADFKAHGLFRVDENARATPIVTGEGLPRTPLYGTRAVIAAPDGDGWLVADPATFGLYRINRAGRISTITTDLDIPQGLVRFDERSVLVADLRSGIGAIMRVGLDGGVSVFAEVDSPKGMAADDELGFVVVSHGARAVYSVTRDGVIAELASGPPLDFPHDIVRLDDGTFVVSDGYASALFRVSRDGRIDVLASGPPLVNPQGIALTEDGDLVVVDPQAGAIFRVTPGGEVEAILRLESRLP